MPTRLPASIDMLQSVMRASIESVGDRRARIFDGVADAAIGADPRDQREDDVLDGDARPQRAGEVDAHGLLLALAQRLRREYAFALAGADAEGNGAEGAMRRGMAVAADQRHARQGEAEFRADDVHDAVAIVLHIGCNGCRNARSWPAAARPAGWPARRAAAGAAAASEPHGRRPRHGSRDDAICGLRHQARKRLRARNLLHEMPVDIEQRASVVIGLHDVLLPDLVVERVCGHRPARRLSL